MLVEALISAILISTTFLSVSGLLSSVKIKNLAYSAEQEAVQVAQDEIERCFASQSEGHGWFWAMTCTNNAPCYAEERPGGWWLSQGTYTYGNYTVGTWFEDIGAKKEMKKLVVHVTWTHDGGGEIVREIIVTNP